MSAEANFVHSVGTEQQMYRLKYDFLRGSAGDSLSDHHYLANFSTYDKVGVPLKTPIPLFWT